MSTASEGGEYEPAGESQGFRRPPFPVFPIVMPLMFPIGLVALLIVLGARRQRALEARLADIQERIEDLTQAMSAAR